MYWKSLMLRLNQGFYVKIWHFWVQHGHREAWLRKVKVPTWVPVHPGPNSESLVGTKWHDEVIPKPRECISLYLFGHHTFLQFRTLQRTILWKKTYSFWVPMVPKRQDEAIQMGQSMSNLQSREHVSFNLVVMAVTYYCNLVPWPSLKMPRI